MATIEFCLIRVFNLSLYNSGLIVILFLISLY